MTDMKQRCESVREKLEAGGVHPSDIWWTESGRVVVEIVWGDWKHDHARADYLVSQLGGKVDDVFVTESDGSDTYSATHFYKF